MPATKRSLNQLIDKGLFAAFALAGSLAILVLKAFELPQTVVTLVPVFLMIVYGLLTVAQWSRFRLRYDQSGDNCYYLGFIYTLVSLGHALYSFTYAAPLGVDHVIRDFGIALATTLVGVTLRVLLHQMREDPHDVEEAAREELGNAASRVTGQISSMIRDVVSLRVTTQDELKHFVYETKQVATEYLTILGKFRDQADGLAGQVETLVARIGAINVPADLLEQRLAPFIASVERLTTLHIAAQKDMAEILESTRDAAKEISRAAEISKEMVSLPERMAAVLEQLSGMAKTISEMQQRALAVSEQLVHAGLKLEGLRALDSVIDRIERLEARQVRRRGIFRTLFGTTSN